MSPADVLLLNFIGVALLYSFSLLNVILFKCTAERSNAVQVSDTTMLNIVEKACYQKNKHTTPNSQPQTQIPQLIKIRELLLIMWYNLMVRA